MAKMNFIFISPHFPPNFKHFVAALKNEGINVLGIGPDPYDNLDSELKSNLTEYYLVRDMDNYEELLRACGYFIHKYGRIDYIESHNEHWLQAEAQLRTDFNVSGYKLAAIDKIKKKSEMKKIFEKEDIPVARGIIATDAQAVRQFVKKVGYPIIAKPNIGVGAANTYKISNRTELGYFLEGKPDCEYLIEEFIPGEIHTFDGLVDERGKLIFINSYIFKDGVLDTVSSGLNQFYYNQMSVPKDLLMAGLKLLRAFEVRERFFHFEFFRTKKEKLIALEVNIRPPGGQSLDMFNYSCDIDIYKMYAEMIAGKKIKDPPKAKYHCAYIGVKGKDSSSNSIAKIINKYGEIICVHGPVPKIFSKALGDYSYIIRSQEMAEIMKASEAICQQ